ncbi:MAG TPA: YdeI/OmpD-associated family protein [Streptosporangiaceae bacterium]
MRFRAILELNGKTATGIPVPPEVVAELGQGKRPAVQVTIGSHAYRSTVGVMGGRYLIPVSAEHRAAAGVAPGDELDVEVTLDSAPREVAVPDDFAEALGADAVASEAFGKLPYSHKQRWVLSITQAKTPQTRERRIAKAVEELREK